MDNFDKLLTRCCDIMYSHSELFPIVSLLKDEISPDITLLHYVRYYIGLEYICRDIFEKTKHTMLCVTKDKIESYLEETYKINVKYVLNFYRNLSPTKYETDLWEKMIKEENL